MSRRSLLRGGAALSVLGALSACGRGADVGRIAPDGPEVQRAAAGRRAAGARVRQATVTARVGSVDLDGQTVRTWSYGDGVPGPMLRGSAAEVLRVRVDNQLPQPTAVHWHGLAIRNDMDGVPNLTPTRDRPRGDDGLRVRPADARHLLLPRTSRGAARTRAVRTADHRRPAGARGLRRRVRRGPSTTGPTARAPDRAPRTSCATYAPAASARSTGRRSSRARSPRHSHRTPRWMHRHRSRPSSPGTCSTRSIC